MKLYILEDKKIGYKVLLENKKEEQVEEYEEEVPYWGVIELSKPASDLLEMLKQFEPFHILLKNIGFVQVIGEIITKFELELHKKGKDSLPIKDS